MWTLYRPGLSMEGVNSSILFCLNDLILHCVHMSLSDLPENSSSEPRTKHVHKNMELSQSLEKLMFSKASCFIHLRKKNFF